MEKLQPGDACGECLNQGINHKLRYFYINLEEQLLKCESRYCIWPHNDEVSSSSDEEDQPASVQKTSNVDDVDDDEFIVQMLQQLAAEEPATESIFAAETCSMPDITAVASTLATVGDACHIEDMLNQHRGIIEPQASGECISPKSIPFPLPPKTLSNNDKLLSTTTTTTTAALTAATKTLIYSLPDLLTESSGISNLPRESSPSSWTDSNQPEVTEESIPIAAGSDADNVKFSVSVLELNSRKEVPKTNDPPKTYIFRAPKKASTFSISKRVKPPSPSPPARCSAILSKLLDGEKRQLELRSERGGLKQQRLKHKVGLAGCGGQSRMELRQQLRQSIKAKQAKEVKEATTDSEREVEEEAKQKPNK